MESLEIAHKLLQLITRRLTQMITLNQKLWNLLSFHHNCPFPLLECVCETVLCAVCVWYWRGSVLGKGQRSGALWRKDRAGAPTPPIPPPSPCAVMGCLRGWRFPRQQKPSEEAALCALSVMQNGLLKVAREGAQSDTGWNRYMSNTCKVNNFQPLLTTMLCLCFFSLAR